MKYFKYDDLPARQAEVGFPFYEMARRLVLLCPRNSERTVMLRKLIESRDAALRSVLALLMVLGLAAPAAAQETVEVGKLYQLAFDQSTTTPQPGWTIIYKAYVDNQRIDAVSGPLEGQPGSRVFAMPPLASGGDKVLKVSAQIHIEDPLLWKCGASGAGTVDCTEVMSLPLTVTAIPPTVPDPNPPTGLRIIRTTTVSEIVLTPSGEIVRTTSHTFTQVLDAQDEKKRVLELVEWFRK